MNDLLKNPIHIDYDVNDLKVKQTSNLSMFQKVIGNRPINLMHVKRLADSIKKYGFLCNPVIVNEKMETIDGQHRIEAARMAKSPVFYIVVHGMGLNEVHALNLNQKNWNKVSYMEGFADMGVRDYIILRDFYKKFDFTISTCISLLSNLAADGQFSYTHKAYSRSEKKQVFEEGTWQVRDVDKAYLYAEYINNLAPFFDSYNSAAFVSAFTQALDVDDFEYKRFSHKCKKYGGMFLKPPMTVSVYKNAIEELYNFRAKQKVSLKYKYGK